MSSELLTALAAAGGAALSAVVMYLLKARDTPGAPEVAALKADCERLREVARAAEVSEARAAAEKEAASGKAAAAAEKCAAAEAKVEGLSAEIMRLQGEHSAAQARLASAQAEVRAKDDELTRQKTWFDEQTQHLKALFNNTANQLLQERAAQFGTENKQQIAALLQPFQQQLLDFRVRVDQIHSSEATVRGQLQHQIEQLALTASQVGDKADNLAQAMLGNVKQQGEWGQLQLTTLLEKAGFQEGRHFVNQFYGQNEDEEIRIADTVLSMPNKETLVIDAKVSLPSWSRYCSAENLEEREQAMAAMVASIKTHYQSLASKDYARLVGKGASVPFTVMFVPIEAAGIEAFRAAPDLFSDAQKKKVIIVTPTTLFCVLQLVSALWSIHDKQKNAFEIAEHGGNMLKKLANFLESFASVGNSLKSALGVYEKAQGQLHTGRGNFASLANRMVALGVDAPGSKEFADLISKAELSEGDAEVISITQVAAGGDQPGQR